LYEFSGGRDGAFPYAGLRLSGNTLYGTSGLDFWDSPNYVHTVFAVDTDGSGFTTLHTFEAAAPSTGTNTDGGSPNGLILSSNTLYGTANSRGNSGYGTVFSLTLPPPQLTVISSRANVILTWPTNFTGFSLQSTTNLGSSAIWTTNSPAPVVVNGQNTVTNPISGTQQFFRLSH
jgi:hypothetical protein